MKTETPIRLGLFLTHGVSLRRWEQMGLLDREITPYRELARTNQVDISLITYGDKRDISYKDRLAPIKILPLFADHTPKFTILTFFHAFVGLWRLRHHLRGCDIFKSNQMLGSHLALCAQFFFGGKFMLRTGYEFLDFSIKGQSHLPKQAFAFLLSWLAYKNADMIVVASQNDKEFATRTFPNLRNRHFEIQPNWIDVDKFKPVVNSTINKRDFVFVGRLEYQKNLDALIDAAVLADAELDIIGQGSQEKKLRNQIETNNSDNPKIRILSPIPNSDLPKCFAHYRGFILPSRFEGNPKTLLEAMSCAMPVIGADAPGISSLIDHYENGILCAGNADDLAKAMLELLGNESQARRWGKAARLKIKQRNSLQSFLVEEMIRYKQLSQTKHSN